MSHLPSNQNRSDSPSSDASTSQSSVSVTASSRALRALDQRDYWNSMLRRTARGDMYTPSFLPSYNEIITDLISDIVNLDAEFHLYSAKIRGLIKAVKCSECNRPFRGPVMIPCGHLFCSNCLQNSFRAGIKARLHELLFSEAPESIYLVAYLDRVLPNEEFVKLALKIKSRVLPSHDLNVHKHTCPVCDVYVSARPRRIYTLDYTIDRITDIRLTDQISPFDALLA